MATSTIELNGKLYDARSGKLVNNDSVAANVQPKVVKPSSGVALDGFVRKSTHKPAQAKTHPVHASRPLQKSKTLMRPGVKKPEAVKKEVQESKQEENQAAFTKQDHARIERAKSAPKSNLIRRFSGSSSSIPSVVKKEAALAVAAAPSGNITSTVTHLAEAAENKAQRSVISLENALRNASSHLMEIERNLIDQKGLLERIGFKNKTANLGSLFAAALLLVGFFSYQNIPNVEMRVAATRSGINAHMPGYSPAGFGVADTIQTEPGKVTVSFKSRTDDKNFKLSQQASNWTSDSLLSSHVLASNQPYQTYQDSGRTVYIYDNSNATWVDGGIWYKIEGNASLTSDQLLRIASSL